MALKDVIEYYDQVCKQYNDLLSEIKEFEKEVQTGMIEPERLELLEQTIQPIKNNYQQISWIMFLLNKPARKAKHSGYERRQQKFIKNLSTEHTPKAKLAENADCLNNLKQQFNNRS